MSAEMTNTLANKGSAETDITPSGQNISWVGQYSGEQNDQMNNNPVNKWSEEMDIAPANKRSEELDKTLANKTSEELDRNSGEQTVRRVGQTLANKRSAELDKLWRTKRQQRRT